MTLSGLPLRGAVSRGVIGVGEARITNAAAVSRAAGPATSVFPAPRPGSGHLSR